MRDFYSTLIVLLGSQASLLIGSIALALLLVVSLRKKKSVALYSLVALLNVLFMPIALSYSFNY